jgi:hypothetical protein
MIGIAHALLPLAIAKFQCKVERLFIFRMLPLDNAKFPSTVKRLFIFLFISIS